MRRMVQYKLMVVIGLGVLCCSLTWPNVARAQGSTAAVQQERQYAPLPKPQIYQGTPYLSGGLGKEEADAVRQMGRDYNVELTFSLQNGDYLADVPVVIKDNQGNVAVDVKAEGPLFYTRLSPGQYTVIAQHNGQIKQQAIQVGQKQTQLHMTW